ncbi:MAG: esterase [Phycisphaerae bacterium]
MISALSRPDTSAAGNISPPVPLVIGESFTIESVVLGETRRINVFEPTVYGEKLTGPLPVLYMLDGGLNEDFLHIAGLVQVLVCNGGMRPFLLVGIENTQRRRDLTGPTASDEDKKIAPVVGGSEAFRRFLEDELMPAVRDRYTTTAESAIIGESLAGLFVVETSIVDPGLFTTYIAIDPSLWWNNGHLFREASAGRSPRPERSTSLFVATSRDSQFAPAANELCRALSAAGGGNLRVQYVPFEDETHATIYHPAATRALRAVFGAEETGSPR